MPKIFWNNFMGLTPAGQSRGSAPVTKIGRDYEFDNSTGFDPVKRPGILTISRGTNQDLDTNNRITNVIKRQVPYISSTSAHYLIENGPKTHGVSSNDGVLDASPYNNFPVSTIAEGATHTTGPHTTFVNDDIIVYKHNLASTPTYSLFVSYSDNTDGDVARISTDGGTTDFDFMSGTATGGAVLNIAPHPLLVAENGFLYIGDGSAVHKYDGSTGANGTFTASAIDAPTGWVIKDLLDYKGFCWIFAINNQANTGATLKPPREAAIFLWNYISRKSGEFSGFDKSSPYIFQNVSEIGPMFIHDGVPHLFLLTGGGNTQLRRWTGSEFAVAWEEPGNIIPYKSGISEYFNHIVWFAGGSIYSFGRTSPSFPEVFNKLTTIGGSNSGILTIGGSTNYWITYDDNFVLWGSLTRTCSLSLIPKQLPKLSKVTSMTIYYPPHSDTTVSTLTASLYKNYKTSAESLTMTATHILDGTRGYKVWIPLNITGVNTIRPTFDYTLHASATGGFEPYMVEIEYEPTTQKK